MEPVLEGGHHSVVAAAAAHGPEQIAVFMRIGGNAFAASCDNVHGYQVVDTEAVLAPHVPDPAAQRQTSDAGLCDIAAGSCQVEHLAFSIDLAPGGAALGVDRLGRTVDPHSAH